MLDPKARKLATQLGALLAAYVPEAREGHAAMDLLAAIQEGFTSGGKAIRLDLPMDLSDHDVMDADFNIQGPKTLTLHAGGSRLTIASPNAKPNPTSSLNGDFSFNEEGVLIADIRSSLGFNHKLK